MLKKLFSALVDFFYPPRCANCDGLSEESGALCRDCRGRAFSVRAYQAQSIGLENIDAVLVMAHYKGGLQDILHKVKFFQEKHLIKVLRSEFVQVWNKSGKEDLDRFLHDFCVAGESIAAVMVPTDEKRFRQRGYDLPELLFADWAKEEGYEVFSGLKRVKETRPQYELTGLERKNNMKNVMEAFFVPESKVILIFDDILTTGATLSECARAVKKASSEDKIVIGITLASDNQG